MSDSDPSCSKFLPTFSLAQTRRTHCDRCFKPNPKFRCAGCQAVVYCSRDCQKAAWSTHKAMCISELNTNVELRPNDLGYPSALSLQEALDEWIEVQRWCLYTLTCALVQLEGGVDAALASQKALVLHVVPRHRSEHGGNPAMAFRFGRAVIADKSSDDDVRANWACIQESVNLVHGASTLAFLGSDPDGTRDELVAPVGTLAVVYVLYRMGAVRYDAFTLFHLPLRHVESQDPAAGRTRAALEDLVRMMKEALCNILVYRRPEDPRQPEPDWWICEPAGRRRKTWKWRLFPADEEKWQKREELLDQIVPDRTSGLTALQVLTLFDYGRAKW